MDIFHTNCIDCHKETKAAKEKSGPIECGECHQDRVTVNVFLESHRHGQIPALSAFESHG